MSASCAFLRARKNAPAAGCLDKSHGTSVNLAPFKRGSKSANSLLRPAASICRATPRVHSLRAALVWSVRSASGAVTVSKSPFCTQYVIGCFWTNLSAKNTDRWVDRFSKCPNGAAAATAEANKKDSAQRNFILIVYPPMLSRARAQRPKSI